MTLSNKIETRRARWSRWIKEHSASMKDAALNIRRAFGLVWQAHPPSALAMAGCSLIGALLPASQAWVGKLIVAEFILVVLHAVNSQARTLAEHVLHARLNLAINTRIIRKALELDLTHFENAEYYDKLQNARREADWRGL